jgi:cytochrome c
MLTDKNSLIRAGLIKVEPYEFVDDIGNKREEVMHGLSRCTVCHTLDSSSQSSFAPSLKNVYGDPIGSGAYKNYSTGIAAYGKGKVWSDKNLRLFLKNPQNFIPGTNMPNLNLRNDEIENVIKMLKKLKNEK